MAMNDSIIGGFCQEGYDSASSSYSDLFEQKFNSFNPSAIVSDGVGRLKSGFFDMDVEEDSNLSLGYKNSSPATTPKPGRFFD